jgi:negative regulator of sigma E activity
MKNILFRLMVAAALTLAALTLSSSAHGQQADEDATPTASGSQAETPPFQRQKVHGAAGKGHSQARDEKQHNPDQPYRARPLILPVPMSAGHL